MLGGGGEEGRGTDCRAPRRWVSASAPVSAAMLENPGVGSGEFWFSCLCVCVGELSLSGGAARGSPRSLRREGCWNDRGVVSSCATVSRARRCVRVSE